MAGLEFAWAHMDNLLVLTKGSYEDHLDKLEQTFKHLSEAGLKVNAKKSFFAHTELEPLGYWIARDGIQPLPEKLKLSSA